MKSYVLKQQEINYCDDYEIIIVGGGPSGCAAAIASGRKGAKTLLIEATGCLGGMGTMGLVPMWCPFSDGKKVIYKGIAEEIFEASKAGLDASKVNVVDWLPINPEYLKKVYDDKVTDSGADILFNTMLCAVEEKDGEVDAIIVSNKAGLTAYKAKVYVDCTGDADLAAWAGAEILPAEDEGGYQPASHCFEVSNVDMEALNRNGPFHTSNPDCVIYKIVASGKYDIPDNHMCNNEVTPGTIGFNAGHIWDVDNTDPASVSNALLKGRKLANEIHRALVENQPEAFANSKLSLTAPLMGIRESRRILGDYVLGIEDYIQRQIFDDEICRACYYIDVHHTAAEVKLMNEGKIDLEAKSRRLEAGESYGIPYRCLTPKGLSNVLVAGRSISTERLVQGSTRVMPVCLCMGEAAGKAAAIAKDAEKVDVHNIDISILRQQIIEDGGYIK